MTEIHLHVLPATTNHYLTGYSFCLIEHSQQSRLNLKVISDLMRSHLGCDSEKLQYISSSTVKTTSDTLQ